MADRLKIGLLGGSFDPVHKAHIRLALAAREHLNLDGVQLIPAAHPWQREPLRVAPEHRLRMLELACQDLPGLSVNPIELHRHGQTFTIDTLRSLPASADYIWVLGADQLANFCTWHQWREILQHVQLAVATRPGHPGTPPLALALALESLPEKPLLRIPFEPDATSATQIRRALALGENVDHLLNARVLAYIHTHQLYQSGVTPQEPIT